MSFAYMPIFTGDYLRDTRHLTPLRHGVYFMALMHCWDSKGPMPLDEQECAGICNCRSSDEIEAMRYVLGKYFVKLDDGYYNKRMSEEVAKSELISGARRGAGLKSAEARRKAREACAKQESSNCSTSVKQELVSPSPSPSPSLVIPSLPTVEKVVKDESSSTASDCPHAEILKLWAKNLPSARQPSEWTAARQTALRSRWREKKNRQSLEWWDRFFAYIAQSDFLMGRSSTTGRAPFEVSIDWVLKSANFLKIIEGAYENREVQHG